MSYAPLSLWLFLTLLLTLLEGVNSSSSSSFPDRAETIDLILVDNELLILSLSGEDILLIEFLSILTSSESSWVIDFDGLRTWFSRAIRSRTVSSGLAFTQPIVWRVEGGE